MYDIVFKNATIVSDGSINVQDVAVQDQRIVKIAGSISAPAKKEVNLKGLHMLPGIIDDQVHFREPGLTHKADIQSESRAAVAGGVTSFMEMPNTKPPALDSEELEKKYAKAAQVSPANYSFFLGASNDNIEDIKRVDSKNVCGVKIFMGSSTGNMLVDNDKALEQIFTHSPILIATHCEDEATIAQNQLYYSKTFGDKLNATYHPAIRSREGCYLSSSKAIELAQQTNARLHILHISTADETHLFTNKIPLAQKRITSEVCVHHLTFDSQDYPRLGNLIKCNPAIKEPFDQEALWAALLDDRLDIIATDHAPHTWDEKQQHFNQAPSGLPLIQHTLVMMLQHYHAGRISLERLVEKMCHAPAECFQLAQRGHIKEGFYADLAIVNLDSPWLVTKQNIAYKCGWSPIEGRELQSRVVATYVNGEEVYDGVSVFNKPAGMRLTFER